MKHSATVSACAKKITTSLLAAALVLFLFCLPSFAQLNLGTISGAVRDQTGGAIAGATVNVIDEARGTTRPLISDSAGEYTAPSLTPGTYTVHAEAKGFKIEEHTGIELGVGKEVRVDLVLQPGEQTQTVTVTGELPMVTTTNAQLGGTVENLSVEELPVNGRNYTYMLMDRPGMNLNRAGGQSWSGDGTDVTSTAWMFDGMLDLMYVASQAPIVGGETLGPDAPSFLPLDAIQEVTMVEAGKAEYGWKYGAHVNVGLKSGTNSLHGTAYAYGRDTGLDAKNAFLLATEPKAPLAMEQFGASVGGPIKKNKLFYFMNYEGQRYSVGVPQVAHLPTYADLSGTSGATGNSIPDAIFDILHNVANTNGTIPSALSLNLAGCTALVPAGSVTPAGTLAATQVAVLRSETAAQLASGCNAAAGILGGNQTNSTAIVTDFVGRGQSDNGIAKFDYHPNDHNAFNAEYYIGGGTQIIASTAIEPYWEGDIYTKPQVVRGVWVWTPNSSWVNDLRFGFDRNNAPIYNYECSHPQGVPNYAALGFVAGNFPCPGPSNPVYGGFPVTTISGYSNLGNTETIFQDQLVWYYAINDSVSYTRGNHAFKFGGEVRFNYFDGSGSAGGRGVISFGTVAPFTGATALEDFMAGVPSTGEILVGQQYGAYNFKEYAGFAQDDWRVFPKLTLNLGVRYEYTGSLYAAGNLMGNFNPNAPGVGPTGLIQQTSSHNVYTSSPLDFAPRLGLAYDVTGKGTTVVRAGFNMMYSTLTGLVHIITSQGAYLNGIPTGFTFYNPNGSTFAGPGNIESGAVNLATAQLPWQVNVPVFNAASTSGLACGDGVAPVNPVAGAPAVEPAPCFLQVMDPNLGHYAQMYYRTLGVQHAFTNNLSLEVSYVGSRGSHLLDQTANINTPTPGAKNTAANGYIEQARRPYNTQYPDYAVINYETPNIEANYNGLQTTLTQRITSGLNFTVGYTLEHYLDDSATALHSTQQLLEYGNATSDVRNNFTFTATYLLPSRKSPAQLLEGWQVSTDMILQNSFPLNADDTTNDISGTGLNIDRWTLVGNTRDFNLGGAGPIPCWGVTGSSFSKASNCTTVAAVTNMPALCQSAASAEVVNPSLPAGTPAATGLTALSTYGCYMTGASAIVPPAQGTFGTMARDALYYKGFRNWNLAVTKNWKFKERYSAQFRADFYNVLNRTLYAAPSANLAAPTTFGESSSTPDVNNPVTGNGPRKIQLGVKIIF